MELQRKTFGELDVHHLYELLQLRSEVFVVEQDCVYQDLDGKDRNANHLLGYYENTLVAYTRIFGPGQYFKYPSIGRVVVKQAYRKYGFGKRLMQESINAVYELYGHQTIAISAQLYLKKFYEDLGFMQNGASYLEDGIPHIKMLLTKS